MPISTAPAPEATGLTIVHRTSRGSRSSQIPTTLSVANDPADGADLTIHRVTKTHHGRTLLMLGHAGEYLVNSRRFLGQGKVTDSDIEAIHILMGLSRSVFDEYADGVSRGRRLDGLVLGCLTRLLN
jgi:hypothetical protein